MIDFEFYYGELSDEVFNAEEYLSKQYDAYLQLQTENYIFRNEWYDADYGIEGTYADRFYSLTGWDASKDGLDLPPEERWVDYGGEFTDTMIDGNGEFVVSLKIGEMGFGEDTYFRGLSVSTDIPSQLYNEGYIDITNVSVQMDDQPAKDFYYIYTEKDYVSITILSEYVSGVGTDSISYTMPTDTISIRFTISGLNTQSTQEPTDPEPGTGDSTPSGDTEAEEGGAGCSGSVEFSAMAVAAAVLVAGVALLSRKGSKEHERKNVR